MKNRLLILLPLLAAAAATAAPAPEFAARDRAAVGSCLTRIVSREISGGAVRIQRVQATKSRVRIYASIGLSYYPFREENVRAIYDSVRAQLPATYRKARIELYTDGRKIEELIPLAYRRAVNRRKIATFVHPVQKPLVTRLSAAHTPDKGLAGRHIALWQSHGRYFDQPQNRWKWQRSMLWETCEDLYTQSYVLPFLVPMLENAGACVMLPRERDVQKIELIADNDPGVDTGTSYAETSGAEPWGDGGEGFAHRQHTYRTGENPFTHGTSRRVRTVTGSRPESSAVWSAAIPEAGEYAVYVSYRTEPGSADDALYTVHHLGGESRFAVNQTMGGGTWICLGSFRFAPGEQPVVTLSNRSSVAGRIVSADAVKIGGGYGNIRRTPCDSLRTPGAGYFEETSGSPRFCEGARYWLQWAGFGEEVYAPKDHKDDYKEDYMSRAHWVNALMGGSERLPDEPGLGIPVDLALAFHSDAGVRSGDEVVGTLGIFFTRENKGRFEGGADRYLSRDLTDMVMTQIVGDIRSTCEPEWCRRGLWNRSYYEARVPAVPTMLLELLSHQNFADMRYGNDPRFRFLVSRAVYKGMLRYLAFQYDVPFVVQPLPVEAFRAEFAGDASLHLAWTPVSDPLEPTAEPAAYVLYTRVDDGDFDAGRRVETNGCTVDLEPGRLYGFKVTAVNDGGESFPSEILAAGVVPGEKGRVLVVNGFDRISAPLTERTDSTAGFRRDLDDGVPYLRDISFIGCQRVFDLGAAGLADDTKALGACADDFETEVVGGNTFDYPSVHGRAVMQAGYSFCSASVRSVERGDTRLTEYRVVDLILGKQRAVTLGRGVDGYEFACFSGALQQALRDFRSQRGALLVSGSYAASDLCCGPCSSDADRAFAGQVLHFAFDRSLSLRHSVASVAASRADLAPGEYRFEGGERSDRYAVVAPETLLPVGEGAFPVMRYVENRLVAGVGWEDDAGRGCVLGFPFEAISSEGERCRLMQSLLDFFEPAK